MKYKILRINEDASFRKFYRLISNKKSKIIVLSKKEKYKNLVAYSAINKFLRSNKIYAPKLYKHNFAKGINILDRNAPCKKGNTLFKSSDGGVNTFKKEWMT